ncbi:MAG TPA: pilin [Candidatus Bipolaricaulota bacterium]|nr:pilin [Candidatus Bipolaricaulota bacterium]
MKIKKTTLAILLLVIMSAMFGFSELAKAADLREAIPNLKISIPTLQEGFQQPVVISKCPKDKPNCAPNEKQAFASIPWIAQYVSAIYKYALGLAAIMATISVMIGGVLYLTSAGNPQRIGTAKNMIIGAISGMAIIIFSYVFLNLINPELVKLSPIEIQTVLEEQLATGQSCSSLGGQFLVQVGAETTDPSNASNHSKYLCGSYYPVSVAAGAAGSAGGSCLGDFCPTGSCVEFEGNTQCVNALFYGTIKRTGLGRIIDKITLMGITSDNEVVTIKEYPISGTDSYIIPLTGDIDAKVRNAQKFFFLIEINDTDNWAYWAKFQATKNQSLMDLIGDRIAGAFTPTWDDDVPAVRSYKDSNKAILGTALPIPVELSQALGKACETCRVFERDPETWQHWTAKPFCKFWTAEEVLGIIGANGGLGIRVNFDTDDFPEDYTKVEADELAIYNTMPCGPIYGCDLKYEENSAYTQYDPKKTKAECEAAAKSSAGQTVGGGSCQINEVWTTKNDPDGNPLVCLPAGGVGQYEWSGGKEGEAIDNSNLVNPKDVQHFGVELHSRYASLGTQLPTVSCVDGTKPTWLDAQGAWDAVGCEKTTGDVYYCSGRCLGPDKQVSSTPGSKCIGGVSCFPFNGQKLICNMSSQTCQFGVWGDYCASDIHCDTSSGFTCNMDLKACVKNGAGQQWQACSSDADCGGSLKCLYPAYIDSDNGGCGTFPESFPEAARGSWEDVNYGSSTNNRKICWDPAKNNDVNGLCDCEANLQCGSDNEKWSDAELCNTDGLNYCSSVIEGARCDTDKDTPLAGGYICDERNYLIKKIQ